MPSSGGNGMGKKKEYEKALEDLQIELVGLTRWLRLTGKRMLVIFEGRDAAGKGGTIKAITDKLDTRRRAWSLWASRAPPKNRSGTSSATWHTCLPRVNSFCSTAAGTTARWSSRPWVSAPTTSTSTS
jgi:hypothetical protein